MTAVSQSMLWKSLVALGFVAAISGTASPQPSPSPTPPSLNLTAALAERACKPGAADEVVVCGERGKSRYRIERNVLNAIRAKEAASNPSRVVDREGGEEACGTGRNECGGGALPLVEGALRVAAAAAKAIEGEDWREPFRNGPNDYQRYQDAKAKRGRVSVDVGVSAKVAN